MAGSVTDTRRPQSATPGMNWHARAGKWYGKVQDKLKRTASGGPKWEYTRLYADEAECVAALEALRAKIEGEYWAELTRRADADATTHGLALGPYHAADADVGVAYWRPNPKADHDPYRCVRKSAGERVRWAQACKHASGCAHLAVQAAEGAPCEFCKPHGGHCPCGKTWWRCRKCNPNVTSNAANCSSCATRLSSKRVVRNGGAGLCPGCTPPTAAAAAAVVNAAQNGASVDHVAKAARQARKAQEAAMHNALVLGDYTESFAAGLTPRPGEFIREAYFDHRCALARDFGVGERKFGYVDFVVRTRTGRLVFLEVDEGKHTHITQLCESTRMSNICSSIALSDAGASISVLWLRVNPDTGFRMADGTQCTLRALDTKARTRDVVAFLDGLQAAESDPAMAIGYAYYDLDRNGRPAVLADPGYDARVAECVVQISDGKQGLVSPRALKR